MNFEANKSQNIAAFLKQRNTGKNHNSMGNLAKKSAVEPKMCNFRNSDFSIYAT